MSTTMVGVIVIGRNEGQRLVRCLESVKLESDCIVYVDSGSTDGSVAAAQRLGAMVVELDLVRPFTAARARNEGLAALRSARPDIQFVQFIDGDCELVRGWIQAALTFLAQRSDVAVACGRRRERYPEASVYNWLCDLEWDTPVGEATACGGDALMRVQALEAVGVFLPQLRAGEEPELCLRLREQGWSIWRLDAEMTRHDAAIVRFRQWWLRAVRGGFGGAEVSRLHRHSRFRIYQRETARAILWGGVLPWVIAVGVLIHPMSVILALAYPLQVCRVALRRGVGSSQSWLYATFMMLAKFAEFRGILSFHWHRLRNQRADLIDYKQCP
jgi:glycosyltransferase involved in cell wall biosynthesis